MTQDFVRYDTSDKGFVLRIYNTLLENLRQGSFKEYLHDIEIQLSTFIVPSYDEFIDCLTVASRELEKYHDEYDLYLFSVS